jgi:hypothetical protein
MKHTVTAMVAAIALLSSLHSPESARAGTASPFPEVTIPAPERRSHVVAYTSFVAGAGLIAVSFSFADRANHAFDEYRVAIEPRDIQRLYDRAVLNDRLSSGSLLTGEVLIATGLYLRFLRSAPENRLSLHLGPERCALALRF